MRAAGARRRVSADRELTAAGISDPDRRADYRHCRTVAAEYGRTYFLATRLLPLARRPAVHALYAFARTADEIVDDMDSTMSRRQQAAALDALARELHAGPESSLAICRAVADAAVRHGIAPDTFTDFLAAMRMDLTVTEYDTYDDLSSYMHGSAAVIGAQMLPVLGTIGPVRDAARYAGDLGVAFQLTNFIRDVGEDLRRGRIYLPQSSLRRFGVDRTRLSAALTSRSPVHADIRSLLAFEIARARAIYRRAQPGLDLLEPPSRHCVRVAFILYRDILDQIERNDFDVFTRRAHVSGRRRLRVAAPGIARSYGARGAGGVRSAAGYVIAPRRSGPVPQRDDARATSTRTESG